MSKDKAYFNWFDKLPAHLPKTVSELCELNIFASVKIKLDHTYHLCIAYPMSGQKEFRDNFINYNNLLAIDIKKINDICASDHSLYQNDDVVLLSDLAQLSYLLKNAHSNIDTIIDSFAGIVDIDLYACIWH